MKKVILFSITMLAILAMTMIPSAFSWCIPPNPAGEDNKYELYGPHVKGILIKIYANTEDEWTAMDAGQLDFEDWALEKAWADKWSTPGGPITLQNYGGEAGYMLLDINNNATYTPVDTTPGTDNPTRDVHLRQALAYLVNRTWIVNDLCNGLANAMYTVVPTYMAGYVNHDIAPGGSLEALTYGTDQGNVTAADELLNLTGFPKGADGWRYWDKNLNGVKDAGEDLNLIFYSRQGQRGTFGDWYNTRLTSEPIKIHTTYYSNKPRSFCNGPVFNQEYYSLYTGGWIFIGPDPDFLCDLYNGSNYYHPGAPNNYLGLDDAQLNTYLTQVKLASSLPIATAATLASQVRFAQIAAAVPLWCAAGVKAYKNVPVEGGGNWTQMVNQKGQGVNSWWSTLDMYKQCDLYPNFTYYGFSSTVSNLNVIYTQWYWDSEVTGRIYDGGAGRDPMTLASWVPQLYQYWETGTWTDPTTKETKTKVTVKMRPDVFWQDGTPVTVNDVYYTLVEVSKDILAKGLPPPWWYPTVQYMRSVSIIDDYTVEILLDVNSVFASGWVIGSVIIPKHIWKPIVDASTVLNNLVGGRQPDPNMIGSGPFRFYSEVPDQTIALVRNEPDSIVHGVKSPGYYNYYPTRASIYSLLTFTNTTNVDLNDPRNSQWVMLTPYPTNPATLVGYKFMMTDRQNDTTLPDPLDQGDPVFLVNATNNDLPPVFEPKGKWYITFEVELGGNGYILKVIFCHTKFNMPHSANYLPAGTLPITFGIEEESLWLNDCTGGELIVNKYVYVDGVLQPGFPKDVVLETLPDGTIVPVKEEFTLTTTTCHHVIKVAFHIKGPAMLDGIHPNPWICTWENVTLHYWVTILEDGGGATLYDYVYPTPYTTINGLPAKYVFASELPAPDCKVGIKDILTAAKAFGGKPGDFNWNSVADGNRDYKVDIKDILIIAKAFGLI
jgi:ABC-type transport system substrate-binding protein